MPQVTVTINGHPHAVQCDPGEEHRIRDLARLVGSGQPAHRAASLLLTSLFAAVIIGGVFETVARTACCFAIKH